jgi:hypothetical protein
MERPAESLGYGLRNTTITAKERNGGSVADSAANSVQS